MHVTIDWVQLAELVGAIQGFVLAAVLLAHRTNRTANRLLAALMVALSVSLISEVYYSAGLVSSYPHFFGVSYPLPWLFGPLVYLYAVAASDRAWRFDRRAMLHILPAILVVVLGGGIYLQSGAAKVALYARLRSGYVPTLFMLLEPTKYLSGVAYSIATLAHMRAHRHRVENSYSNIDRVNLRWLRSLAGAAAGIWALAIISDILGLIPATASSRRGDLVALAGSLLVYGIGYKGLRQPEIFRFDVDDTPPPPASPTPPATVVAAPVDAVEVTAAVASAAATIGAPSDNRSRYERSGLGDFEARKLVASLKGAMENQRLYRDPELTLSTLAGHLATTPHKLSEVLNGELAQTFYDFVNRYRVEEVTNRLGDPRTKHLNILALGLDAGFASKSTFNQAFKKVTGQTPSSYRKALEARKALAG